MNTDYFMVFRGRFLNRWYTFDDLHLSTHGRMITQAFLIELPASESLPKVKGGDDAEKAFWLPLADMNPEKMFEDHYFIVRHLLGECCACKNLMLRYYRRIVH